MMMRYAKKERKKIKRKDDELFNSINPLFWQQRQRCHRSNSSIDIGAKKKKLHQPQVQEFTFLTFRFQMKNSLFHFSSIYMSYGTQLTWKWNKVSLLTGCLLPELY